MLGRGTYETVCAENDRTPDPGFRSNLIFMIFVMRRLADCSSVGSIMMEVATITGHKTLVMFKRYTHLRAEDLAKKLRKMR